MASWLDKSARLPSGVSGFTHWLGGGDRAPASSESAEQTPLRSELFSADQMAQHGVALAGQHQVGRSGHPDRLLQRLTDNHRVLLDTRSLLTSAVSGGLPVAPAGEWLLDNFYLIEEQIRTAQRHLPKRYNRELPCLASGQSQGLPRVYDLALEVISHGDGRVDSETLEHFVSAYQRSTALTLGELWAIPIMLRLALIENLRRVSARLAASRQHLNLARRWAEEMMEVAETDPKSLILVIADMARSEPPLVSPFIAELVRRLQGHGPALALPLSWIEQRLAESSRTTEQLIQLENQQQAADQVSIGNTIGSLRFLGSMDWNTFVENTSVVEHILRAGGDGHYPLMDFATRDQYRQVIDRLAKRSSSSEAEVAHAVVNLAAGGAADPDADPVRGHVGYYLIEHGLPELEAVVCARLKPGEGLRRAAGRHPLTLYLGSILLLTLALAAVFVRIAAQAGVHGPFLVLTAAIAFLAVSPLASALTHCGTTLLVRPRRLPRLDFSRGIAPGLGTLVVVPTLLTDPGTIQVLLERLEVHFLGNRDPKLQYGLLTDFTDAEVEHVDGDAALLNQVRRGIQRLNQRYSTPTFEPFVLFHRARRWNPGERLWMGYERKRGKLADLNAALREGDYPRFACVIGDRSALADVKYVITLDTDTELPRDAARLLVATMAHPLNRPRYNPSRRCVVGGYGILQPRLSATLTGTPRSRYANWFGTEPGIDPYSRSVSDVYQDLFDEGSFIGKGIYEVEAFETTLKDRFPENRILSHDLLEGCHARSGLLSDVHLFEASPTRYTDDVRRHHRWIRGDWQIARWLWPWVPGGESHTQPNPLSALSRWKILDNLRRSLAPAALSVLLLIGWLAVPDAGVWTLIAVGVGLIPALLAGAVEVLRWSESTPLASHLAVALRSTLRNLVLASFRLACLPFEAGMNLDAVIRTLWRTQVSRHRLLEWSVAKPLALSRPGSDEPVAPLSVGAELLETYRVLWIAPAFALSSWVLIGLLQPMALLVATPLLVLWALAPAFATLLSWPETRETEALGADEQLFLRRLARKTWAFFERHVGAEDHWLPPDNVQEHPGPKVAHRTSPTNMGLSLLANLAAFDFGYLSARRLVERCEAAITTMCGLEQHQGHFYNWYDTVSLQPLRPRYISSVDSGNLAGHLLTLRAGLMALADLPLRGPRLFAGISDTLEVLSACGAKLPQRSVDAARRLIDEAEVEGGDLSQAQPRLLALEQIARELQAALSPDDPPEAHWWAATLHQQTTEASLEGQRLDPGLAFPAPRSTLRLLAEDSASLLAELEHRASQAPIGEPRAAIQAQLERYRLCQAEARDRIARIDALVNRISALCNPPFDFLYDRPRRLLSIGYSVENYRLDDSFYDLLASEARLCSFVAIAQGQLPQESWFALGRLLTRQGGDPVLMSWSGSMFEYLMPLLVMPAYPDTLLDQTCRSAVTRQIAYGQQRGLPWGVSESGYLTVDSNLNYQYRAFGVPGLGLQRGLAEDAVVAPYASALALLVAPEAACTNLQALSASGFEGPLGLYEAIDYTPSRLALTNPSVQGRPDSNTDPATDPARAVVRSFMAHHQGMSLLAFGHVLHDRPMQRRFESDPSLQATLLLLQERVPRSVAFETPVPGEAEDSPREEPVTPYTQAPIGLDLPFPEVNLLSNGHYQVLVSNAGGGYSRWRELAVTRWREDSTCDHWGSFLYLRDTDSGAVWSSTHLPTRRRADHYEALFSEGRVEFRRRDLDIETYTEIVVSPEDDVELRRVRLTNRSSRQRTLELTSYAEAVLSLPAADQMQAAFGKLFVQTEILASRRTLLCTRRPRSAGEPVNWLFHLLATHGASVGEVSFETDRMRFIGRGRNLEAPLALSESGALSNTQGAVLDPIVAIRCQVVLAAEQSVTLDWVTGAADSRESVLALVDKMQDRHLADRVFDLAWTHAGVTLRQINANEADARAYRRLAGPVIYSQNTLRAEASVIAENRRGQSGLWGYAISGDLPIVLLKISESTQIDLARQLIQCHAYWRLKGLAVDLVIWNDEQAGYRQRLQEQILGLIATGSEPPAGQRSGGIFVRPAEQISSEDRVLLQSVARAILVGGRGSLQEQVSRRPIALPGQPRLVPSRAVLPGPQPVLPTPELQLANGLGGFSLDGAEYLITTRRDQSTPVPWVNVLANAGFGSVISESGLAYTWSENAHEFRLTPWSDDAVGATSGEAFYLRDEETGQFWSPCPAPRPGVEPYLTRHGFGYSSFEHLESGLYSQLEVFVDLEASVKFSVLRVRNGSGRSRRLSATGYVEWVLGDLRPKSAPHVVTEIDASSGALFARNAFSTEFAGRAAFFDVDDPSRTLSGDRQEFLGRYGSLGNPAALSRVRLSGRVGAGLDPCGALQVPFELADGQEREVIFRLGSGIDLHHARELAQRLRRPGSARAARVRVGQYWTHTLAAVRVETPDPALNVLANGWLVYQTLACRFWARSGFYQSGGAYGFRDQLQDSMALLHAEPGLARAHLLRCAAHQFVEGDVQHWWHPPADSGVRTRCSDDFLWLPWAVCRYVTVTGDSAVLLEQAHFLDGRSLGADEESYYDRPVRSASTATLYEHCVRAIRRGLRFGERGLPLIGSGDWNDGMNQVGIHGRGESVWLGFFLYQILESFSALAQRHGDAAFAGQCSAEAVRLRQALDTEAWDGQWYRRAWFDDGTPIGSASNPECAIDSIAQSWAVLSGAGEDQHARQAMDSLDRHLVQRDLGIVKLLDPPFDQWPVNPGYIKGYVPGVRENGGQYTHAAIWAAMAFAKLKDRKRTGDLLKLINPVNHTRDAGEISRYKAEPYVVAADVYARMPHAGRGGWTWYTGSAGWFYRLIIESVLGITREGDELRLLPCLPAHWDHCTLSYRFGTTRYRIELRLDPDLKPGEMAMQQDGMPLDKPVARLVDDQAEHRIEVRLGE